MNGGVEGDEKGEWTYEGGRGTSVIDYVMVQEEMREEVKRLEVGDCTDSDHYPVVAWLKGERRRGKEGRKRGVGMNRGIWDGEGKELFERRLGSLSWREGEVNEIIKEMGSKVREALKEVGKERGDTREKRGWWDTECAEKKRELRRELRAWRRTGEGGSEFRDRKKEYRELCWRKRKEENEKWEKVVEGARTESQVWGVVNRDRKKWIGINRGIEMEEWEDYFMGLLGGVEERVIRGGGVGEWEGEEEIRKEEIREVLDRMKAGKAMGVDGVPYEVWKWGGRGMLEWVWGICNRVWKGEGWPKEWNEGVIVPVRKKGRGEGVGDYRGVTLMPTLYKVYASVLAGRLREDVEERGLIPPNQTGFRRGMGTIDNIFTLNYLINRELGGKGRRICALFVDLKAAFDTVERGVLLEALRGRGVREGIIVRVGKVLEESKSRVRVGEKLGKGFWTARGVRQGCPLSPLLFNLLIADLEEELRKVKWGGLRLGEGRIYSLAYADDLVLLAEEEGELRSMIARLEGYIDRKGLELNINKTKVMRFKKGGGRLKEVSWRWKGSRLEEVKEFCYLGYTLQRNGGQEAHLRDRVKKAAAVMGQVWGIGKRRFGRDWGRRVWLYDKLVWTVMSYGVEIWGWRERERLEKLHERYLRWILGVEWRTPGYMVREELQREKMRTRAGIRAWGFEERLERGGGSELAKRCLEEVREREKKGGRQSEWEAERKVFWEENGISEEERERLREGGEIGKVLTEGDRERQREERWGRIRRSEYNKWYGRVKGEGVPEYLRNGWGESRWRRVARFRMGNEVKERLYWEEEEERGCRLCGFEQETWEHLWEGCRRWDNGGGGGWQEVVDRILGDEGKGEDWMREVEREREEGGSRGGRNVRRWLARVNGYMCGTTVEEWREVWETEAQLE